MPRFTSALVTFLAYAASVSAHAVITDVIGNNGVNGQGFGIIEDTPRNCTVEQPCQLDTPVLKDLQIDPCGATLAEGSIPVEENLELAIEQGNGELPAFSSDGFIELQLHQVNADGGGPFLAQVNLDGTGNEFIDAEVITQPPGAEGIIREGPNVDATMVVQLPDGAECTGGNGNACIVRVSNGGSTSLANGAGPFGGCFAAQQDDGANARLAKRSFLQRRDVVKSHVLELAKREIVRRALDLTPGDLEDIKTTLGTAIDPPIDRLAGQDDASPFGGNSTDGTFDENATLTLQQAVDLKKAVESSIAAGLNVLMTTDETQIDNPVDSDEVADANAIFNQEIEDGERTSINAGNAGVGFVDDEQQEFLLGDVTEVVAATPTEVLADVALETVTPAASSDDQDEESSSDSDSGDDNNGRGFGGFGGFGRGGFKQRKRSYPRRIHF